MKPDYTLYKQTKKVLIVAAIVAMVAPLVFTFCTNGANFVNG